ncbi:germin subfamily 1 member 15 [Siccirubricoccus deserti]|uniref:Cupin domain-containing protein n=1 Tax=Siccirubricoccus deserti TaxID=2013562 RepID=A0A9X0UIF3_9PROT|nr:cupin domain-containing protein [Siccirubricoccus deserti]MBC4017050.1 cupin domain-containing protein [Siccirubricoccus deserti]GGC56534.1 germin subfamily 1 member 15 [Siccirubricoccus deserti]
MADVTIRPAGSRATKTASSDSFTGTVLQDSMATPQAPSRTSATLVTFTPGARTNWHTHKTRQVLVATQGTGMVQVKDKPPRILRAGDVAEVPPGLVHWHGAVAGHLFAHISFVETDGPDNTTWMEPVDEAHYRSVAVPPEA